MGGLNVCAADQCSHTHQNCHMHRFPKDGERKMVWISNLQYGTFTPKDYQRLCACHFEKNMLKGDRSRQILTRTAIPTIFTTHAVKSKGARTRAHRKPLGNLASVFNSKANEVVPPVDNVEQCDNVNSLADFLKPRGLDLSDLPELEPYINRSNDLLSPDSFITPTSVANEAVSSGDGADTNLDSLKDFLESRGLELSDLPELGPYINRSEDSSSSNSLITSASAEDAENSVFYLINDGESDIMLSPSDFEKYLTVCHDEEEDALDVANADSATNVPSLVDTEADSVEDPSNIDPLSTSTPGNSGRSAINPTTPATSNENPSSDLDSVLQDEAVSQLLIDLQKEKDAQKREIYRLRKEVTKANKIKQNFNPDEQKRLMTSRVQQWCKETLRKALQIRFAVGKRGYEFLISKGYPLPSYPTLCRRVQKLPLSCGVSSKIGFLMKQKAASLVAGEKNCILSFDEMEIKSGLEYDKGQERMVGKATLGDRSKLASKLLLLVARGVTTNWKQVIGWHLTPSTCPSKEELWDFLFEGLRTMETATYHVWGVISDMGSGNRAMWSMAGTSATKGAATKKGNKGKRKAQNKKTARNRKRPQNGETAQDSRENGDDNVNEDKNAEEGNQAADDMPQTSIPHPFRENEKIYFFFDNPHLLKNLKSSFLSHNIKLSDKIVKKYKLDSPYVSSHWVGKFVDLQDCPDIVFKPAPFLTKAMLYPSQYEKMRVGYATAIFHERVIAGMETAVLRGLLPAEANTTIWFMKQVIGWFRIVSGRNIKTSITRRNFAKKKATIDNFNELMEELSTEDNRWKPWQTGIIITNTNLLEMAKKLLFTKKIHYFLGARVSQDGIENIFSQIRRRGNKMPFPLQALRAVRLLCVSQFTGESRFSNYFDGKDNPHLDILKSPFKRSPRCKPTPSSRSPAKAKRAKKGTSNPPRVLFSKGINVEGTVEVSEVEQRQNLPGPSSINQDQGDEEQFGEKAACNVELQNLPGPSTRKRSRDEDQDDEGGAITEPLDIPGQPPINRDHTEENDSQAEAEEEQRICDELSGILDMEINPPAGTLNPLEEETLIDSIGYMIKCTRSFACKKRCKYLDFKAVRRESLFTACRDKGGLIYVPEPVRMLGKRLESLCRARMNNMSEFSLKEIDDMIKTIINVHGQPLCKCRFFEEFCKKFIRTRMYFKLDGIQKSLANVKRKRGKKACQATPSTTLRP